MHINYTDIFKKNLENILKDILKIISKEGLKSGHHLYLTIDTKNKNLKIPIWLRKKYTKEITIVIQYEYKNLKVYKDSFSIELSFDNINSKLSVPFDAVKSFADPFANFGLQLFSKDNESKKIKYNKEKTITKNKVIKLDSYRKD